MKKIYTVVAACWSLLSFAQQNGKWQDMFSFNHIISIVNKENKIVAVTENGLFYYSPDSGEVSKFTKINGLHEVKISATAYNPSTQTMLIGYKSGNIDIIDAEGKITYAVDIPLSPNVTTSKEIRHISIQDNQAVISADYGVSIFNLDKKEFGNTCFFPEGTKAIESAFLGDQLFVATNKGLKSQNWKSISFVNFSSWNNEGLSGISQMESVDGKLLAANSKTIYVNTGNGFTILKDGFSGIQDIHENEGYIAVADKISDEDYQTKVIDFSGVLQVEHPFSVPVSTGLYANGQLFSGTITKGLSMGETGIFIKPDGPYNNTSSRLYLRDGKIWVATVLLNDSFGPLTSDNLGYYYYNGSAWEYPSFFEEKENFGMNVSDVIPDATHPDVVYFTNFQQEPKRGVYRLEKKLDGTYSSQVFLGVDKADKWYFLPYGVVQKDGYLLSSIQTIQIDESSNKQHIYDAGFYFGKPTPSQVKKFTNLKNQIGFPLITEKTIWAGNAKGNNTDNKAGLLAVLYDGDMSSISSAPVKYMGTDNGLLNNSATCYAMDVYGDLWIGNRTGLRVLQNAEESIRQPNPIAEPIVITQGGIAEELFKDLHIQSIAIDSGNKKWVSIKDNGVFYLSADGQQVLQKFTSQNSALPNNNILDIKIDDKTGKVYFATADGIVVYQGDVSEVGSGFGEVVVYPNPVVYSQYKGNITIKGLAEKTHIRITDTAGNLVHSAVAQGGVYEWNLLNTRGIRVASGIYFVLMTNADGTDKKAVKIAVVNS
ncbi:T9SS type A sorting domain-containing protein [Elizabethkingia sp. JS20170427COW]|uniref:type IX secretion system anionic LPS delivery protein PorZ n=1 Tax=Elizabethkingia sp. JS20170427COW TaxID=2583851 RepID=UPI0011106A1D|nr:T9SS type A sorting domain-containing protein [Elizabethkingia sp. JS20170427COW]QCX52855.1 T9SS type A sorting domain-containing protein [Elizabethkingia sp. JS20170427COW]